MLRMPWRRSSLPSRAPCLPNQASGYAHDAEAFRLCFPLGHKRLSFLESWGLYDPFARQGFSHHCLDDHP